MNYYINKGFTAAELNEKMERFNQELRELGALYEGTVKIEDYTKFQFSCDTMDTDGYGFDEQIFDTYGEIGAILEAIKNLEGVTK